MVNKITKHKVFSLGATVLISTAAFSFAEKFDVKPGLWEITTTTEMGGMATPAMPAIPPDTLAKMPPEQRARIQAMMANRGAGKAMTDKSCVTEKELEHGLRPDTDKEQSCKVDSMTSSGKTQEMHLSCTNSRGNGTGVLKITATSRESYEGTMDMTSNVNGRSTTVKILMKGKWLAANCGNVKD